MQIELSVVGKRRFDNKLHQYFGCGAFVSGYYTKVDSTPHCYSTKFLKQAGGECECNLVSYVLMA